MAGLNMFPIFVILLFANCALPTLAHLDDSPYAFDVYNYIFKGKKIDDFSCRALVALGKPCHNVFVNSTFTYEHTGNRTAIQARADRVFNHCIIATSLHCILMCNAYFSRNLGCSSHFKHVRNYCPLYGYSYDHDILGNSHTFVVSGSKLRMMKTSLRRIAQIVYKTSLNNKRRAFVE
ncbi:unnamed protein product [Malus baccata var. baccata]